ncbi:MAG: hypothetical protein ACRCZS_25815 [Chroococcidiopsis sp.]
MNNRTEYEPNSKVHSENVHPETIPTVEKTPKSKRIGVVEEIPVRREKVTTTNSTSHSDSNKPKKSKQDYGPSLPILAAIACCIPLAGILGYLVRGERVVTRTVTQTVPVLTVPASPVSPAPNAASPSPVGPEVVGPEVVGPEKVGPARVGVDRVGNK